MPQQDGVPPAVVKQMVADGHQNVAGAVETPVDPLNHPGEIEPLLGHLLLGLLEHHHVPAELVRLTLELVDQGP